jgi:hypothetical protein
MTTSSGMRNPRPNFPRFCFLHCRWWQSTSISKHVSFSSFLRSHYNAPLTSFCFSSPRFLYIAQGETTLNSYCNFNLILLTAPHSTAAVTQGPLAVLHFPHFDAASSSPWPPACSPPNPCRCISAKRSMNSARKHRNYSNCNLWNIIRS